MEHSDRLNLSFHALADPTRRGIVGLLIEQRQRRISDLAEPFSMSLAAVSKHIRVLEKAELVTRVKRGREYYLQLNVNPLREVGDWVGFYEQFWKQRFTKLESMLAMENPEHKQGESK
ncbi:MAG: metalloregulator ArsR/SmtB family transcription factor [Gammaproteobacteria bacterium]